MIVNGKSYTVQPVKIDEMHSDGSIDLTRCEEDDPDLFLWSVYEIDEFGMVHCVEDFGCKSDAYDYLSNITKGE